MHWGCRDNVITSRTFTRVADEPLQRLLGLLRTITFRDGPGDGHGDEDADQLIEYLDDHARGEHVPQDVAARSEEEGGQGAAASR